MVLPDPTPLPITTGQAVEGPLTATDGNVAVFDGPSGDKIKDGGSLTGASDWVSNASTWTYDSADAPSFVVSVNADVSSVLSLGMRLRLTQTTAKYFIVTKVGAFGGGATLVTLYGGTDYTLANAAITSPSYSSAKAPFGFPLNPAQWTVELQGGGIGVGQNGANWEKLDHGAGSSVYDIVVPIGCWNLGYEYNVEVNGNTGEKNIYFTLSSDGTTNTNPELCSYLNSDVSTIAFVFAAARSAFVQVTSKTQFFVLGKTDSDFASSQLLGKVDAPNRTFAICAYL